ncbi:MAG: hypothetical protein AAGF90_07335 [Pseudomonadota bacterium]
MTDYAEMLDALLSGTLDPASFSHRDHVGVAFEALSRHEPMEALARLSDALRRLAARAGAPEKFNATITFAYVSLIAERRAEGGFATADAFIDANADLLDAAALTARYTSGRLHSPLARRAPLLPDRAAG